MRCRSDGISGIQKINAKPTSIVMFKQFRKKKRSLHEATARKGRKTPNAMSKRNAKNTKYARGFWLNDYVRIKNSHSKGCISGFSKTACYIRDIFGNYLTVSPKYNQVALSKLLRITHNNNWSNQEISENNYQMY